jgi:hypothetical protein
VLQSGSRRVDPLSLGRYSRRLQRTVVDFGAEDSFGLAARRLELHYGVSLSASSVRKLTLSHAATIARQQQPEGTVGGLAACGADYIIAQSDGTMLPILETRKARSRDLRKRRSCQWNEFRLCATRAQGSTRTCYGVSQGDVDQAGYVWAACAARSQWGLNTSIHVVCDGARWITSQADQNFGSKASVLIDFYHLSQYLARAAQGIHACDKQAGIWLKTQQKRLKSGKHQLLLDELNHHLEPTECEDLEAPVRLALRYITNRPDQLDYPHAIKNDLPIGSGLIEGAHRHVLHKRLKLSGAWWRLHNATAMAHLRVARANNDEAKYWDNLALQA